MIEIKDIFIMEVQKETMEVQILMKI